MCNKISWIMHTSGKPGIWSKFSQIMVNWSDLGPKALCCGQKISNEDTCLLVNPYCSYGNLAIAIVTSAWRCHSHVEAESSSKRHSHVEAESSSKCHSHIKAESLTWIFKIRPVIEIHASDNGGGANDVIPITWMGLHRWPFHGFLQHGWRNHGSVNDVVQFSSMCSHWNVLHRRFKLLLHFDGLHMCSRKNDLKYGQVTILNASVMSNICSIMSKLIAI